MLEILFVVFLCSAIGKQCRKKNIKPKMYQFLMAMFWIGGEIMGAIVGAAIADGEVGILVIGAYGGAAVGTAIAFGIVAAVPPGPKPIYGGGVRNSGPVVIGPPGSGGFQGIGPAVQRSDADAQVAAQQAQQCEQGQRWGEAAQLWKTVIQTSTDARMIDYARQRSAQIDQYLAQHFQAGR